MASPFFVSQAASKCVLLLFQLFAHFKRFAHHTVHLQVVIGRVVKYKGLEPFHGNTTGIVQHAFAHADIHQTSQHIAFLPR